MGKQTHHSRPKHRKIPLILGGSFILLFLLLAIFCIFPDFLCAEDPSASVLDSNSVAFRIARPESELLSVNASLPKAFESSSKTPLTQDELFQAEEDFASLLTESKLVSGAYYSEDENGNVLYAYNEHERMYPASMTKLMTAILAIENTSDLDAVFTVGNLDGSFDEDSILLELKEGDRISMRDALYGLLMVSYNDCATAIAIQVGGSLEGFCAMMNEKAQSIGCSDTHFTTPNGLHRDDHYSSAYDMTKILKYALSDQTLQDIMLTERHTAMIYGQDGDRSEEYEGSNYFVRGIYDIPYMNYEGGKTGFTYIARSNLASCFSKDGVRYYTTVMDSTDASFMTMLLLDRHFEPLRCYDDYLTTPEMEYYVLSTT